MKNQEEKQQRESGIKQNKRKGGSGVQPLPREDYARAKEASRAYAPGEQNHRATGMEPGSGAYRPGGPSVAGTGETPGRTLVPLMSEDNHQEKSHEEKPRETLEEFSKRLGIKYHKG